MILDSSAIVAILRDEPEADLFSRTISAAPRLALSAGSYVELSVVIARNLAAAALDGVEQLLRHYEVAIEPVTVDHARLARAGYLRFGQVSGSPAKLNFGDCFAYALAKATGEPLLFKGNDFIHTDVTPAL